MFIRTLLVRYKLFQTWKLSLSCVGRATTTTCVSSCPLKRLQKKRRSPPRGWVGEHLLQFWTVVFWLWLLTQLGTVMKFSVLFALIYSGLWPPSGQHWKLILILFQLIVFVASLATANDCATDAIQEACCKLNIVGCRSSDSSECKRECETGWEEVDGLDGCFTTDCTSKFQWNQKIKTCEVTTSEEGQSCKFGDGRDTKAICLPEQNTNSSDFVCRSPARGKFLKIRISISIMGVSVGTRLVPLASCVVMSSRAAWLIFTYRLCVTFIQLRYGAHILARRGGRTITLWWSFHQGPNGQAQIYLYSRGRRRRCIFSRQSRTPLPVLDCCWPSHLSGHLFMHLKRARFASVTSISAVCRMGCDFDSRDYANCSFCFWHMICYDIYKKMHAQFCYFN